MRPDLSRVPASFHGYINEVKEDDLVTAFRNQTPAFVQALKNIPADRIDYRYAPGKWTVREVLQHIIDGERVFSYRALRFARKDATPLPGFDENLWADNAKADRRDWMDMVDEFYHLRRATEIQFAAYDEEQLEAAGTSSGQPNYVRAFGFVIVGHAQHHWTILNERYLDR